MFFLRKDSCREFTKQQYEIMANVAKNIVDIPIEVKLYWNSDMDCDNGVLGCFSVKYPNAIFLMSGFGIDHIKLMLPTLAHELTHRKQFKKLGKLKYSIYAIPLLRQSLLEKEARAVERLVEIEINK